MAPEKGAGSRERRIYPTEVRSSWNKRCWFQPS